MASIFAGNSYSYYRSLHQFNYMHSGTKETVDINKFNYLYNNALVTLQTDISNFGNGYMDRLNDFKSKNYLISLDAASLIGDKYNTPEITKLSNYKYEPTIFNRYRQIFINIAQGLDNAILVNKELTEKVKEQAKQIDILKNMPLEDYIMTQPKMTNLYTETNVNIQSSELLPWFSEYLFQYGPPNGAFDPNLLAVIVDTQIRKGLYTIEDFLSSDKIIPL